MIHRRYLENHKMDKNIITLYKLEFLFKYYSICSNYDYWFKYYEEYVYLEKNKSRKLLIGPQIQIFKK